MQNRVPVARVDRPALPDFSPVPRKYRHDGWTPERQKAFIEALADTGCVSRAAAMVNMAQANCYTLRRAPGAESFRRAWDAALDYGLARLKDIAFERAIDGHRVPVFAGGKLMGFQRKTNDALLMFCLRHYGKDDQGRRTTINYFSTRAEAGAGSGPSGDAAGAAAQASTTTVRTVISGDGQGGGAMALAERGDALAHTLNGFDGVALDAEATAAIETALLACATRQREALAAMDTGGEAGVAAEMDDPANDFVRVDENDPYWGTLEPPDGGEEFVPFVEGEVPWEMAGEEEE